MDKLQIVSRARILRCAVHVVTGRYKEIPGLSAKRLGIAPRGSDILIRNDDGGVAMRCSIQEKTASAARFMWEENPDGTPVLKRVAVHDDIAI